MADEAKLLENEIATLKAQIIELEKKNNRSKERLHELLEKIKSIIGTAENGRIRYALEVAHKIYSEHPARQKELKEDYVRFREYVAERDAYERIRVLLCNIL